MDEHNINVSINLNLPAVHCFIERFVGPTKPGRVGTLKNGLD